MPEPDATALATLHAAAYSPSPIWMPALPDRLAIAFLRIAEMGSCLTAT